MALDSTTRSLHRNDFGSSVRPEELRDITLLEHVALESVWGVLEHCRAIALDAGQGIMRPQHPSEAMYLVVSGALRPEVGEELGRTTAGGEEAVVREGGVAGWVSLLEGSPVPARLVAVEPTRLVAVDEETLWRLVTMSHAFAANLLVGLCSRLRERNAVMTTHIDVAVHGDQETAVDGLTGLHTRQWLTALLPRYVGRAERDHKPLSILVADIDHLKQYNDTFGFATGDRILTAVGRIMRWCLRPSDQSARFAGEELCAVLPETALDGARAAAKRLHHTVEKSEIVDDEGVRLPGVTITVGVAQLVEGGDAESLLGACAAALALAKKNGGNGVGG
jgi:diguanylate cyclase (GGDEF)-like protein